MSGVGLRPRFSTNNPDGSYTSPFHSANALRVKAREDGRGMGFNVGEGGVDAMLRYENGFVCELIWSALGGNFETVGFRW